MPLLLWVAFWSCMMGSAAALGETPESKRKEAPDPRNQPAV